MSKKYASLAENPLVKSWLSSYPALNSRISHLKRLGQLTNTLQVTPEYIIEQVKSGNGKALKQKVKTYCIDLVNQGKTSTANMTLSTFRSFILSQELQIVWTRQDLITIVATQIERRVPAKEEVYRIIDGLEADTQLSKETIAKYKAMVLTQYQSGIRPGALLKLKVKHVDLSHEPPVPIRITPDVDSKIRRPLARIGYYWAFISKQAQEAIREYLTFRQNLTPDSPLFESDTHRPITYRTWNNVVHRIAKYSGFKRAELAPHGFRHGFRKAIRPFVDDQVGTVLTGHTIKGSEEHYFDRKDANYLAHEYVKVDWVRDKPPTDILVEQNEELRKLRADQTTRDLEVEKLTAQNSALEARLAKLEATSVERLMLAAANTKQSIQKRPKKE